MASVSTSRPPARPYMFKLCREDVLTVSVKDIQSTKDLKNKLQAVYNYVHKLMCSCSFFDPHTAEVESDKDGVTG